MASAVIRTGGKQFHVAEGDLLRVPKLRGNPGDALELGEVLMLGGESPKVGTPTVAGAAVSASIVRHGRGPRLVVFKFKRRKRYKRRAGHRQDFTEVKITSITG